MELLELRTVGSWNSFHHVLLGKDPLRSDSWLFLSLTSGMKTFVRVARGAKTVKDLREYNDLDESIYSLLLREEALHKLVELLGESSKTSVREFPSFIKILQCKERPALRRVEVTDNRTLLEFWLTKLNSTDWLVSSHGAFPRGWVLVRKEGDLPPDRHLSRQNVAEALARDNAGLFDIPVEQWRMDGTRLAFFAYLRMSDLDIQNMDEAVDVEQIRLRMID